MIRYGTTSARRDGDGCCGRYIIVYIVGKITSEFSEFSGGEREKRGCSRLFSFFFSFPFFLPSEPYWCLCEKPLVGNVPVLTEFPPSQRLVEGCCAGTMRHGTIDRG